MRAFMARLASFSAALLVAACIYFESPFGTYADDLQLVALQWQDVLAVGDSALLIVQLLDEEERPFSSSEITITWETSDPLIAGLHSGREKLQKWVLGFKPGTATIVIEAAQPAHGSSKGNNRKPAIRVQLERTVEVRPAAAAR